MDEVFDQRPIIIAIAGPNGSGKTTFFRSHFAQTGLPFINADLIAVKLRLDPYDAAKVADVVRRHFLASRTSFFFETVFSDPVGEKVGFLEEAARKGWIVVLCFIGIADSDQSLERVAMRVSQGGHDVPDEKLKARYSRTMENLRAAIRRLPHVIVYDNCDLSSPYQHVATFQFGHARHLTELVPNWLTDQIPR